MQTQPNTLAFVFVQYFVYHSVQYHNQYSVEYSVRYNVQDTKGEVSSWNESDHLATLKLGTVYGMVQSTVQ